MFKYVETVSGNAWIVGIAPMRILLVSGEVTSGRFKPESAAVIDTPIPTKSAIDAMGARQKALESEFAGIAALDPSLWTVARLDVRCGRSLTRGMARPYDPRFGESMVATARGLMLSRHAVAAYVQSDEITLVWKPCGSDSQPMFGGRVVKWLSTLAGEASARLALALYQVGVTSATPPHLDCRIVQGGVDVAEESITWRSADAFRNAIQSAGQSWIGRKAVLDKSTTTILRHLIVDRELRERWTALPDHARFGTHLRRATVERVLSGDERAAIPERYRPAPDQRVIRTDVVVVPIRDINFDRVALATYGQESM